MHQSPTATPPAPHRVRGAAGLSAGCTLHALHCTSGHTCARTPHLRPGGTLSGSDGSLLQVVNAPHAEVSDRSWLEGVPEAVWGGGAPTGGWYASQHAAATLSGASAQLPGKGGEAAR